MKVRVAYTVEASDDYRRAINLFYGEPGLASRDDVRRWLMAYGTSEDDNLMYGLDREEGDDEEGR